MKKPWILFLFIFLSIACKNSSYEVSKIKATQITLNAEIKQDSTIIQVFQPYKDKMTEEITKSLSYAPLQLERTDGNLQSTLGNLMWFISKLTVPTTMLKCLQHERIQFTAFRSWF